MALGARLWINVVYPQDMMPDLTSAQIDARGPRHEKLAY